MKFIDIGHNFIFHVRNGNLAQILSQYFTSKTIVEVTRLCNSKKEYRTLEPFCKYLQKVTIVQCKLENIEVKNDTLAFQIFMITKDKGGSIDLTEHTVTSFWNNNKITKHIHTIISY